MHRNLRDKEEAQRFFFELWGMDLGCFQRGNDFWTQSFKGKVSTYGDVEETFQREGQQNQRSPVNGVFRNAEWTVIWLEVAAGLGSQQGWGWGLAMLVGVRLQLVGVRLQRPD